MSVPFKTCKNRGCKNPDRCKHPWYYKIQDTRFGRVQGAIDEYAAWHHDPEKGPFQKVRTKSAAQDWVDAIKQGMKAGVDPRIPPVQVKDETPPPPATRTIAQYIDEVYTPDYVDIADLTLDGREDKRSKLRIIKNLVGEMSFEALVTDEPIKEIRRVYAKNEVSTKNRYLGALNSLIRYAKEKGHLKGDNPFELKANKINTKAEAERDRRLVEGEEDALFEACERLIHQPCGTKKLTWEKVNEIRRRVAAGELQRELAVAFGLSTGTVADIMTQKIWNPERERATGFSMRDRIIGGIDTCCRITEMALIQNKNVNWTSGYIGIPKASMKKNPKTGRREIATKGKMARLVPFRNLDGVDISPRLTALLQRRKALGPDAYVFGDWNTGAFVANWSKTWYVLVLLAHGKTPVWTKTGGLGEQSWKDIEEINLHWHDLRHEGLSRYGDGNLDPRVIQLLAGHKKLSTTMRYVHLSKVFTAADSMVDAVKERNRRLQLVASRKTGEESA